MNAVTRTKRTSWQITKAVIFALVLREFQTRFGSRRMGAFWVLFEPIAHISIMMFIFMVIRIRHIPGIDFPVWLLAGMLPFFLMRNIALKLMDSVEANRALFAYPNIKIFDTYIARTIVEFITGASIYIILMFVLGFWLAYNINIAYPLNWLCHLAIGIVFSFSLGVIFSVTVQVMPNAKSLIQLIFMPLYLISGVIFPLWMIPTKYLSWVLWNPFAHIIDNIRSSIFHIYPQTPGVNVIYPLSVTIIFLFFSLSLYFIRKDFLLTK